MKSKKGFTLIELLVVVLIIGILAAIAVPQYQKAVLKSRFTQLIVLQEAIARAENNYYLANNSYAAKFEDLDVSMPAGERTYDSQNNLSYFFGKNYTIVISATWTQGFINEISYVTYHNSKTRQCRAYQNNQTSREICLALGGIEESFSYDNWSVYTIK